MSTRAREASRLVQPVFGRRHVRIVPSRDGLKILKWRGRLRGMALALRRINGVALAFATLLLLTAETQAALTAVLATGTIAYFIERLLDGPATRRPRRIVRDLRPALLHSVIVVPQQRRAGRIVRSRPPPIDLSLPTSTRRSRIVERRPGPVFGEAE